LNDILLAVATLASALMGGIFFAFSSFVMPALGRIPPAEGVRAMQRINIDVFHWSFMLCFFGTPLLSAILLIHGIRSWGQAGSAALLLGGLAYIIGCFGVTVVGNVPLNNSLATLNPDELNPDELNPDELDPDELNPDDPHSEDWESASAWAAYAVPWTRWNHVRTLFCMVAAASYLMALFAN